MYLYASISRFSKGHKSVQRWQNRFHYNTRTYFFVIFFVNLKLLFFLRNINFSKLVNTYWYIIFKNSSPKENVMFEILMKQIRPDMKLLLKVRLSWFFNLTYWYMDVVWNVDSKWKLCGFTVSFITCCSCLFQSFCSHFVFSSSFNFSLLISF